MKTRTPRIAAASSALLGLLAGCIGGPDEEGLPGVRRRTLDAYCEVVVEGVGTRDVEGDYLPHVVACENGAASFEALRVQAVSARSFVYYKIETSGSVRDGTSDQVYSCGRAPGDEHYEAVRSTSGEVLTYGGDVLCAFYVAGAIPSTADCYPASGDSDPTGTEHYVTYNEGLTGDAIEQTTLGWVDPRNTRNRGCMSQNGADCLSDHGWGYRDILRFYYGDDIVLERTVGSCVEPPADGDGDLDADTDVDTDADTDTDTDTDGDADAEEDGGPDGDVDGDADADEQDVDDAEPDGPDEGPHLQPRAMSGGCACRAAGPAPARAGLARLLTYR